MNNDDMPPHVDEEKWRNGGYHHNDIDDEPEEVPYINPDRPLLPPDVALKIFLSKMPRFARRYAKYRQLQKARRKKRGFDKERRKERARETYAGGRTANWGEPGVHYSIRLTPTAKAVAQEAGAGKYIEGLIRADKPEQFKEKSDV
jgi:hypothetical protein